jgi:hypothetical protein
MLALTAPSFASAQVSHLVGDKAVLVAAGERVVLKIAVDGRLTLVSAKPAPLAAAAPPKPRSNAPLEDAPNGAVAVLLGADEKGALLKIDSGIDQAFDLHAEALSQPKAAGEPLSVCTLLPLLAGYENWPGRRVPFILLSDFKTRATNEVVCPGRK